MALSVVMYHYTAYSLGVPGSESLLGRLGIYAVSTFYIISGMSMFIVYQNERWSLKALTSFVLKRYFRIAPVFWLAILLPALWYAVIKDHYYDGYRLFSNIFLFFGFYDPRAYIPGGGWSIGNEMVFYAFFPLIIVASRNCWLFVGVLATLFLVYCYFAFFVLSPDKGLVVQWGEYINPLNQIFLFAAGVALAWGRKLFGSPSKVIVCVTLLVSLLLFVFYPVSGDRINIVTGVNRILFTFFCVGVCFSLLNLDFELRPALSSFLQFFGDISYSLYLLHIALYFYVQNLILKKLGADSDFLKFFILFFFSLPLAVLVSYLVHQYLEKPAIRFAKTITASKNRVSAMSTNA